MMSDPRDDRFFGIFGLSLAVAGLLIPIVIANFTGEEQAGGFLIIAQMLALTFGILGRKTKPGIVAITIPGAAILLILIVSLIKAT